MEFLVDMVTTVPNGTTDAEVAAIRAREAARSRELAAHGRVIIRQDTDGWRIAHYQVSRLD